MSQSQEEHPRSARIRGYGTSTAEAVTFWILGPIAVIARHGHLAGRRSDRIVVTGGLTAAGKVVPVGSVAQKAIAARHANACLFIVPHANIVEARRNSGTVRVVGVDTIVDARSAVANGC